MKHPYYQLRIQGSLFEGMSYGPDCATLTEAKQTARSLAQAKPNATVTIHRITFWKGTDVLRFRRVAAFQAK